MEQYKPIFKKTFNLLEKYYLFVDENCHPHIQNDVSLATSVFEKEMLTAAAEELTRICAAKKAISGTIRIDLTSYNSAFIRAFYLLEKYYLTISDDKWHEVVQDIGGDSTKIECAMLVAVVGEIESIYKAKFADKQRKQADDKETA